MFSKMRLFQKSATAVLVTFMGIMVFVTIIAYSRQSGATRQDMSKAQMLRVEVALQAHQQLSDSENR